MNFDVSPKKDFLGFLSHRLSSLIILFQNLIFDYDNGAS